jgi:hypothetical protein
MSVKSKQPEIQGIASVTEKNSRASRVDPSMSRANKDDHKKIVDNLQNDTKYEILCNNTWYYLGDYINNISTSKNSTSHIFECPNKTLRDVKNDHLKGILKYYHHLNKDIYAYLNFVDYLKHLFVEISNYDKLHNELHHRINSVTLGNKEKVLKTLYHGLIKGSCDDGPAIKRQFMTIAVFLLIINNEIYSMNKSNDFNKFYKSYNFSSYDKNLINTYYIAHDIIFNNFVVLRKSVKNDTCNGMNNLLNELKNTDYKGFKKSFEYQIKNVIGMFDDDPKLDTIVNPNETYNNNNIQRETKSDETMEIFGRFIDLATFNFKRIKEKCRKQKTLPYNGGKKSRKIKKFKTRKIKKSKSRK